MSILGKTFAQTSEKTGLKMKADLAIASDFPTSFDFQIFLINLYLKDFKFYQSYSRTLISYLEQNPDDLTQIELVENKTILSTISAMYFERDRENFEQQDRELKDIQTYLESITKKCK